MPLIVPLFVSDRANYIPKMQMNDISPIRKSGASINARLETFALSTPSAPDGHMGLMLLPALAALSLSGWWVASAPMHW
jgi:hypothetical protein